MSSAARGSIVRKGMGGAALVLLGGLAAGCSGDIQRFSSDRVITGSTANQRAIIKPPASQPYPGDVQASAARIDNDVVTGSTSASAIGKQALEPLPGTQPVRSAAREAVEPALAAVRKAKDAVKSAAAPVLGSNANATRPVDPVTTGSTAPAARTALPKPAIASPDEPAQQGWSRVGGTQITLKEGETLYNLSRRFGVPVSAIVKANGLADAKSVAAGQKILIPTYVYSSSAPVSAPDSNPDVAAAKSSRGTRFDTPVDKVPLPGKAPERSNVAVLPETPRPKDKSTAVVQSNAPAKDKAGAATVAGGYVVKAGDSLWSIAKAAGTSASAIKAANGIGDKPLRIGQRLVIPSGQAAAKAANIDPIITGVATAPKAEKPRSGATQASGPVAYQPPKKAEGAIAEAERADNAVAPEETGIGKMRWPARGKVVGAFGRSGGKVNDGIDISVPEGTPVKAAENGVVIYAGEGLKDLGKTVLVRHENGLVTVYGHNSDIAVQRGDKVTRGQQLARSGMTGSAGAPKLHFEVRKNSAPVDPTTYLD